jgi:hypothetical protein
LLDTGSVAEPQQDSKARSDVFAGEVTEVIEFSVLQKTQKIVAISAKF